MRKEEDNHIQSKVVTSLI